MRIHPTTACAAILAAALSVTSPHADDPAAASPAAEGPRISRAEPSEPRWGDTIHVTYDTKASGAAFVAGDDVSVVVTENAYVASRTVSFGMKGEGAAFTAEVPVPDGTSFLTLSFVTRGAYDDKADIELPIRTRDGDFARGAWLQKANRMHRLTCDGKRCNFDEVYDKELAAHPDSFEVYPARWTRIQVMNRKYFEEIVTADLKRLPPETPDEPADLVHARLAGALALGQGRTAKALLFDLLHRFPRADETAEAFSDVLKATMLKMPGLPSMSDVQAAAFEAVRSEPDGALARQIGEMGGFGKDLPVETIETICSAWETHDPGSPDPFVTLARAYADRGIKTDEGVQAIGKALDLMFTGAARLAGDVHGYYLQYTLPDAYVLDAKLHLARNELPEAYAAALAAAPILRPDDPRALVLEGKIWMAAGDWKQAESAFAKTLSIGSGDWGRKDLETLYASRHGSDAGFDDYLKGLRAVPESKTAASEAGLPAGKVKTLEGQTLDLASLRGKVVVLNFFSIGCAPCIAEMPDLNKLVDGFKGNSQVVFLAAAGDSADNLKTLLEEHPFHYQVIPHDSVLSPHFKIYGWPTHVVIGRDGTVISRLTGAGPSVPDVLERKIKEALR